MADSAGTRDMLTPVLHATEQVIKAYRHALSPESRELLRAPKAKLSPLFEALGELDEVWGEDDG